jgi:peptidoglycan/xylan/chitin deacetylase (PgdA/CDA1 family)
MFHRILPQGEDCYDPEMATSKEAFADFLDWLNQNYRVVSLDLLVSQLAGTIDRKKPVCAITFDDGWLDNFIHAFPLLKARGVPATIFLPVRFIGTKRRFWQERLSFFLVKVWQLEIRRVLIEESARFFPWFPPAYDCLSHNGQLKRFLMTRPSEEAEEFVRSLAETARLDVLSSDRAFMNWDEVREMKGTGISFGSHTLNHTLLPNTEPAKAIQEIRESREELKEHIGDEVTAFSYPWGATSPLTKAGYSREWPPVTRSSGRAQLVSLQIKPGSGSPKTFCNLRSLIAYHAVYLRPRTE